MDYILWINFDFWWHGEAWRIMSLRIKGPFFRDGGVYEAYLGKYSEL